MGVPVAAQLDSISTWRSNTGAIGHRVQRAHRVGDPTVDRDPMRRGFRREGVGADHAPVRDHDEVVIGEPLHDHLRIGRGFAELSQRRRLPPVREPLQNRPMNRPMAVGQGGLTPGERELSDEAGDGAVDVGHPAILATARS